MPAASAGKISPTPRVRIRMYRQGLGDCFLLTFFSDLPPQHILIDCGVLNGTPDGKGRIERLAENIKKETGNRLSALVATHEHWDHVSGFYDARKIFDHMEVGEIWVAWTEDPGNPVARDLKAQNKSRLQGMELALAHLANIDDLRYQVYGQGFANLLGFFGGPAAGAAPAAIAEKTAQAMARVTKRNPPPSYWQPGDLIRRNWLPGVRIYVLGPPLSPALEKKAGGRAGIDTFGLTGADSAFTAALNQALALDNSVDPETARRLNDVLPFDQSLQWREEKWAKSHPTLHQTYAAKDAAWRRIDNDWLLSMARLALQLDNSLNNMSLVLAFEFIDTGQVLLFPGDAQIASWQSWMSLEWQLAASGAAAKTVKTADLLRRTAFYKVSHHGSHNATPAELEVMRAPGLVAAVPVDQIFANTVQNWDMPSKPLWERLQQLTGGRLLRSDAHWPTAADQPPAGMTPEAWANFTASVSLDKDGLYIDYFLGKADKHTG